MDLLVCMFSTTYDKSGLLVAERKVVIMSYVKGWFFFDMIACIPFDTILQGIFDESDCKISLFKNSAIYRSLGLEN
jgi:hypothetical protein